MTRTQQPPPSPKTQNVNAIKMSLIPKTSPDKIPSPVQDSVPVVKTAPKPAPTQHKSAPPIMDSKSTKIISLTPDHFFLVQEIERVTGDTWSRGHFVNLVRQVDEKTIYGALSVRREKVFGIRTEWWSLFHIHFERDDWTWESQSKTGNLSHSRTTSTLLSHT